MQVPPDWTEDLVSVERARTLDGLFRERVRRSGGSPAYRWFDRHAKTWRALTWAETSAQVGRWQHALAGEGLAAGERVAVQLRNSPEWVMFDQAALGLGLVVVPLYTDDRPENLAYIIDDAAARVLLVQDAGHWKRVADALEHCEALERVLLLESGPEARRLAGRDPRIRLVPDWLGPPAEPRARHGDPDALASIVYTSGTTGRSKGVMLSHRNMLSVAHASLTVIDAYQQDVFLSFLPLSHTLERTGGYYLPMMAGASVAFARSIGQLAQDLVEVRPTVLIAVPRVFERVHARLGDRLRKQPAPARWVFGLAVDAGWRSFERIQGRAPWHPKLLLWPALQRMVSKKILGRLGGRMRIAVSGGAALPPEVARVFIALGLPLLQGYGLTEASPVVSVNPLEDNRPDSVGVALRGIEARIGEDQELLVRSPGVMLGYWNNHAATAAMMTPDGWLRTGDQARIEDGYIYITGRLKDILVLSNGEKVPPGDMEMAVTLDPLFEQVLIAGEGRPYLTALLVLDADLWPELAREYGLDPSDEASLSDRRLLAMVQRRVRTALKDFPGYAKIRRVSLLLEPWTVENGLLTPTMKVKRSKVLERYADRIEAMYQA
ncbi:MAG: long-chain fatty acid--CoA ligase [Chromatiales bacterium]